MIGTIEIECQAKNPNMPLWPMRAFLGSPSSLRLRNVPKKIGNWRITSVKIVSEYPDNSIQHVDCVLIGGLWVGTLEGCNVAGKVDNGYTVLADGVDEQGNPVVGYVLGKGDVEILEADGNIPVDVKAWYMHLLSERGEHPNEGDVYKGDDGGYYIWQDGEEQSLAISFAEVSSYVDTQVSSKAEISDVEDLSNSLSDYYTQSETSSSNEIDVALNTKADLSALDDKRSVLDFNVYEDPLANVSAVVFNFTVAYASTPTQPFLSATMVHPQDQSTQWEWQSGDQYCGIYYTSSDQQYVLTYQNIQDGGGNLHDGSITLPLEYPKWSCAAGDEDFYFTVTSQNTMLATQKWVQTQISSKADLTSLNNKQDKLSESQLSAIDKSLYDLQTKISYTNNTTDYFISPSYILSRATLQQLGALDENGQWLKQPRAAEAGTNVLQLETGLFKDATSLQNFTSQTCQYLGAQAFQDCSSLTNVTIPNVQTLGGSNMFNGCTSLTSITLPKSLTMVNKQVFNGSSFQQVIFEDKTLEQVKAMANFSRWGLAEDKILTYAFRNYIDEQLSSKADLSALSDYATVDSLSTKQDVLLSSESQALSAATSDYQTTIKFDDGTTSSFAWYGTFDFQKVYDAGLFDDDTNTWVKNPVNVKIGCGVSHIAGGLNGALSLDNVFIPDSVSAMTNAFQGSGIRSVTLPYGLKTIGSSCFGRCARLSAAYIPDTIEHIGYQAFNGCTNLQVVRLPKYLIDIGNQCFKECVSLSDISIPDSILSIGGEAFKGCTALQHVEIGSGVQRIDHQAFQNCPSITCVQFKDKTMSEISSMAEYPWGLTNTSVISTWNAADEDWVMNEVGYSNISSEGPTLEDRAVQHIVLTAATTTLELPEVPNSSKTYDFVIDMTNAYEDNGTPTSATFSLSGIIGTNFNIIVPEGESFVDMTTLEAGELAEYYFTKTAFDLQSLPTWKVVKQKVEAYIPETI